MRAGDPGLAVGGIQERLGLAGSTLSHHLHRLLIAGLVNQERSGTTLICRANYATMHELVGYLADECCKDVEVSAPNAAAGGCK